MKKIYIEPSIDILKVQVESLMESASIQTGDDWSSGEGASREMDWED